MCVSVQVLQWLIVHADTIQSLLRCHELSMGSLQELSLLTGIISKTALPGTKKTKHIKLKVLLYSLISLLQTTFSHTSEIQ